ncbi:Ribosomal protein L7Ae/L30e/S12e/Gadd45 family protein [Perilla frutescens var. frutescens]|nr:Ribosomal protein L7Ae/L30e/S12e/Gadd45 family protein [Perilla frutescens var. frutescens]
MSVGDWMLRLERRAGWRTDIPILVLPPSVAHTILRLKSERGSEREREREREVEKSAQKEREKKKLLALAPIAKPFASKKLYKRTLKLVRRAVEHKCLKRGVKEVVKSIHRGNKGLCVIAGNISPIDVITHVLILCEELLISKAEESTQQDNWHEGRSLRDDEIGFTTHLNPNSQPESSGTKRDRPNVSHTEDNVLDSQHARLNNGIIGEISSYNRSDIQQNRFLVNDALYINSTEHLGMLLTTDLFDGQKYHNWCRAVRRGLLSRNKLGLLDGSLPKPAIGSLDYMQWRRFGKMNGPRLYKIRREIATFTQGAQTVMVYFNNLSALWDDLSLLKSSKQCFCEAAEDAQRDVEEEHLMQFLMGLNECFEAIRQQILILNPLPTLSQAYAMVLQVEEQMTVSLQFVENVEQSTLYSHNQKGPYKGDKFKKRLTKEEKAKLKCDHCGGSGHLKADCFDLHGIHEWYQKFKAEKGKGRAHFVTDKDDMSKGETDNLHTDVKR